MNSGEYDFINRITQRKLRPKALTEFGKYRFDEFGVCTNPKEYFKYEGVIVTIRVLVAEHPPGYMAGYEISYARNSEAMQILSRSSFPSVSTIYNKQEDAILEAGLELLKEICSHVMEEGFKKLPVDIEFIEQWLTQFGYTKSNNSPSKNTNDMSKKVLTLDADSANELLDVIDQIQKPVLITSADIKEELCNYGYEINTGPGKGDKVTRKGSSFIHHDMDVVFAKLNKHLAHIDDAFTHMKKKPQTVPELEDHEAIISNFTVTGFKISGTDENEGYILKGDKYVNQGSIGLETPKISKSSGYHFFDDLQEVIEECRSEVEQYMNGKQAPKLEQAELEFPAAGGNESDFDNPE